MTHLYRSVAALRIMGDALDPDEITHLLGCAPSSAHRKGDPIRQSRARGPVLARSGMWMLNADDRQPADLDAQIGALFARLPDDPGLWRDLSSRFVIDLFCGFFMHDSDEGIEVSPRALRMLAERSVTLALCLYAPLDPADGA